VASRAGYRTECQDASGKEQENDERFSCHPPLAARRLAIHHASRFSFPLFSHL